MKTKIIIYTIVLMLFSCDYNNDNYIKKRFHESKRIVSEKILIDSVMDPSFLTIKDKYLFVSSIKSGKMMHVYSLPDLKFLYSTGEKGNGPDDFEAFPMFCKSFSDYLFVWGYKHTKINKFSIDSIGGLILEKEFILPSYESFNQMHIIKDSLLVYSAIPSMFSIKKCDLHNGSIADEIQIKKDDHNDSFFYSNRGFVAANDSVLIYAYVYKNQIDIYKMSDFSLRKTIEGDWTKEEIIVGDFENNARYYTSVMAGDKYFYALCIDHESSNKNEYIMEVYDYEGNSIVKYSFDIVPFLFDVDEKNGYIYGFNSDFEDYFLKFKIDPVIKK